MSSEKKPYHAPQLFRVELNPDQAILTACSITASSLVGMGNARCKSPAQAPPAGCKNDASSGMGGGDSAARRS
jgi:hypothetical protein